MMSTTSATSICRMHFRVLRRANSKMQNRYEFSRSGLRVFTQFASYFSAVCLRWKLRETTAISCGGPQLWRAYGRSMRSLGLATAEYVMSSARKRVSGAWDPPFWYPLTPLAFPSIPDTKVPLTPGREKRRTQLRKLNGLSTGIRGLQAKLALLREESERSLNEAEDVSELGPSLMAQYESIGQDLKMLQQAWEEGKAALASGIDRNEKRLSSISGLLSPTTSLSGLTTVEEGGALEAFKALTGESPPSSTFGSTPADHDEAEVFEAVALPRPRSMFTREERIAKMKEDREKREAARESAEANRGMLRELEMVINLRPKRATLPATRPPFGRISI